MKNPYFLIVVIIFVISSFIVFYGIKKTKEDYITRTYSYSCLDYLKHFRKWDVNSLNENQKEILYFLDSINDDRFGTDEKLKYTRNACVFPSSLIPLFNYDEYVLNLQDVPTEYQIQGKFFDLNKINTFEEFKNILNILFAIYDAEIIEEIKKRKKLLERIEEKIVEARAERDRLQQVQNGLNVDLQAEKDNLYCITTVLEEIDTEEEKISNVKGQIDAMNTSINTEQNVLDNAASLDDLYGKCKKGGFDIQTERDIANTEYSLRWPYKQKQLEDERKARADTVTGQLVDMEYSVTQEEDLVTKLRREAEEQRQALAIQQKNEEAARQAKLEQERKEFEEKSFSEKQEHITDTVTSGLTSGIKNMSSGFSVRNIVTNMFAGYGVRI